MFLFQRAGHRLSLALVFTLFISCLSFCYVIFASMIIRPMSVCLLMATCIKAKGRVDFSPTLYATKVLHNDGFEGWLTCCDLTK